MNLFKIYRDKVLKRLVISLAIISLMLPLVFTACTRERENSHENIEESSLNTTIKESDNLDNKVIEYPDVLVLPGKESGEGIVLEESAEVAAEGAEQLDTTGKVSVPSRFSFIRDLAKSIKGTETAGFSNQEYIRIAEENNWLPSDYTEAVLAKPISRAEAAYILVRALNITPEKVWNYEYKDISGDKYEGEILSAMMQGYIEGYSTGNFKPDRPLSGKEMTKLIESIGKSYEERIANWKFAPDGRKIRKTNLPSNAADFEYILADTSNEYYEGCGIITRETGAYVDLFTSREGMIKPKDLTKELGDIEYLKVDKTLPGYEDMVAEWHPYRETIYIKPENFDMVINRYKKYFEHCTNVDYRTINDDWALELYLTLYPHLNKDLYYKNQPKDGSHNIWEAYVDYVKEHKIILKSNRIQVEKSAVYNMNNYMVVRAYVDFDVVNFENLGSSEYYLLTAGNTMGDIALDRAVKGNYRGYVNNLLNLSKHATKGTDFVFSSTNDTGVALGVFYSSFTISPYVLAE